MVTTEEIQKAFKTAPQNLKDYIESDDMERAFYAIRSAYKLHLDHAGNLALAIDAVILGLKSFDQLPQLLQEALSGLDDDTRGKVLKDINDKIFIPLREMSRKHAEEVRKATTLPPPTIRTREVVLANAPEAPVARSIPAAPQAPVVPAAPTTQLVASAATPTPPVMSVIAEKMSTTSAPPRVEQPVAPQAVPNTPAKYHGSDPYKEPIE